MKIIVGQGLNSMNSLDFSRIQACTAGRLKSEGADLNEEMLEMVRREYPETGGGDEGAEHTQSYYRIRH